MSDHFALPGGPRRSWSQRQRHGFLEARLFWEGAVSRADLMERFEISGPQASDDVTKYLEMTQEQGLRFDRLVKKFVAASDFAPRFPIPDARQYLTQLLMLADSAITPRESWLGNVPQFEVMPRLRRRADTHTLRPILKAIRHRRQIEIQYQSMNAPDPIERWIAPHALVYDGTRWHARSWCVNRSTFSDFVLARILKIGQDRPSEVDPRIDRAWQEMFVMKLAPHPDLSCPQRAAIELDYGMHDGSIDIRMRLCMTKYFERLHNLDAAGEATRRQVVLQNRAELDAVRASFDVERE